MALQSFQLRRLSTALTSAVLVVLGTASSTAHAQSVPVPIAGTVAGGGTVCAASISTYAPLAANRKLVGDGCPAAQSTLNNPVALAIDHYNNVAIADQTNDLVRIIYHGGAAMAAAITASIAQAPGTVPVPGDIYTIVGGPQSTPSQSTFYCTQTGSGLIGFNKPLDGCPGNYAYIQPRGMAFDQDGNLYISSLASNYGVRIFYVGGTAAAKLIALENPTLSGAPQPGYVYDIAGTGAPTTATGGDGAIAYKATINQPRGLWIDANENVYFTDTLSGLIRRVDGTTGLISTVAGACTNTANCGTGLSAGDGNPATSSAVKINYPYGEVFDTYGNMFIADSGSGMSAGGRIRVVYAGGTLPGITNPVVGNIYTYAGGGALTGTQAQQTNFQFVYGVALDANGYLYINDYRNATSPGSNHVWRVDPANGNIVSIAGNGGTAAQTAGAFCNGVSGPKATTVRGDGCPAPEAYLNLPQQAPVFDNLGNFYEAERNTNVVRYFSYNNTFASTPVGSSTTQLLAFAYPPATTPLTTTFTGAGASASDFSDGGNDTCVLSTATPAATICTNNVTFTPSAGNTRLGAITTASTATLATQVLVGTGSAAQLTIDPATTTALGSKLKPQGISVDAGGHVYISDAAGKQVLATTPNGGATTAVFTGLTSPQGTTTDSFGNVYVADAGTNSVLQRSTAGTITTVITGLSGPTALAADLYGDIYVADTGNHRVLRYSAFTGYSQAVNTYPQTLNAPTALAVDALGDLFVLDTTSTGAKALLEFPVAALPQTVSLPSGVSPTGFALDHAGNLYLADASSASILVVAPGGSTQTVIHNLVSATGIALDAAGDILLADSGASSATAYQRTTAAAAYADTNVGAQSLPATFNLTSVGDLAARLASPFEVESGNAADFPLVSGNNACANSLALAPGANCTASFTFAPTVKGSRMATVNFTPAAGNAVSATLSGVGVFLTPTSLAITQTSPATSTNSYGQTESFNAMLTAQAGGTGTPTGTVTYTIDGVAQAPQTLSASGNIYSASLPVGIHIIAAAYSGDGNYASSNSTTSITVVPAPTTTVASTAQSAAGVTLNAVMTPAFTGAAAPTGTITFTVDGVTQTPSQPVGNGTVSQIVSVTDGTHTVVATYSGDGNYAKSVSAPQTLVVNRTPTSTALTITPTTTTTTVSLTLVATVKSSTGTPAGTVSFYNGSTLLGTVTLNNGVASLPTALSTNLNFTATYSGNGIYQPSSITVAEAPDFAVLQPSLPLAVPQGAQATTTISAVSVAGYTGSLTAACTNLPVNSLCRFQPIPVTTSPGVNGNLTVQVYVGISSTIAGGASGVWTSLLAALGVLGLLVWRKRSRGLPALLVAALLFVSLASFTGCSQPNAAMTQDNKYITPVGSYPVTITLTDGNGVAHTTTLTVLVNS